jgi:hypothetical protein
MGWGVLTPSFCEDGQPLQVVMMDYKMDIFYRIDVNIFAVILVKVE